MLIPIASWRAALLSAIQLSATPTVLSKLSQPGSNGFSAGSAGFCSVAGGFGSSAARTNVIGTAQLASAKSKPTNVFLIFSTSSKILIVIDSPSLTQRKIMLVTQLKYHAESDGFKKLFQSDGRCEINQMLKY